MYEDDIRICHCVKTDCSDCPMKNIGTAGIRYEQTHRQGKLSEIIEQTKKEQNEDSITINLDSSKRDDFVKPIETDQINKSITINLEYNTNVI